MLSLRKIGYLADSEEGARALFQKLVLHLVKLKLTNAKEIRPCPGDWGIDVIVGELTIGACLIWQAKYFPNGVGDSQKAQIRDSFEQVVKKSKEKKFHITRWYLCIPCSLSGPETVWWEKWKKTKTKETEIEIELYSESELEQLLMTPDAKNIRIELGFEPKAESTYLQTERAIKDLPDKKAMEYDNSLFIRKLVVAGITQNMAARCQFFNAELVQKEIHDKGDENEISELKSLYTKILSMWETRFIEALQSDDKEVETRKVYTNMLKCIEENDKGLLYSPRILATFIHKQGFMQQLSDVCKVGWSPNFRDLDKKD